MEQPPKEEEEDCGICLDALTNPVALPCSHKFCSQCLNGWRSKYGHEDQSTGTKMMDRKCPLCREKIPPSKEMINQLKFWRNAKSSWEAKGDVFSRGYMTAKSEVERLEHEIGDRTEAAINYSADDEENGLLLPPDICRAAMNNNMQKVLDWLGPLPVDKQRINAKDQDGMDTTLVFHAALIKNSGLLSILLQLGADVDAVCAVGGTPLFTLVTMPLDAAGGVRASLACLDAQARLLLEWGAEISNCPISTSKDDFIEGALKHDNTKLANLLRSEFGGRRCEIVNLSNHPDLNGKTCVVDKYLPDKRRYKVTFEASKEAGLVAAENLKRRDRTPDDCGYYITYKNGRFTRRDFASKEACQAFVASLARKDNKSGDADAEAEARAEQAAASLLAELEIDSSAAGVRSKKGKQKKGKKKKGRK